jgi:hypothetical protein
MASLVVALSTGTVASSGAATSGVVDASDGSTGAAASLPHAPLPSARDVTSPSVTNATTRPLISRECPPTPHRTSRSIDPSENGAGLRYE